MQPTQQHRDRSSDRHPSTPTRASYRALLLLPLALALCAACGDDSGGDGDDEVMGEPCSQPGFTMTGCVCDNGGTGSRSCTEDRVWTMCSCRPPLGENECDFEGQEIICNPCPGMAEGRRTTCQASLTFDCSCDGQADPLDGGMGDPDASASVDASTTEDASMQDQDAGLEDDAG